MPPEVVGIVNKLQAWKPAIQLLPEKEGISPQPPEELWGTFSLAIPKCRGYFQRS